jgi:hypothetical protein
MKSSLLLFWNNRCHMFFLAVGSTTPSWTNGQRCEDNVVFFWTLTCWILCEHTVSQSDAVLSASGSYDTVVKSCLCSKHHVFTFMRRQGFPHDLCWNTVDSSKICQRLILMYGSMIHIHLFLVLIQHRWNIADHNTVLKTKIWHSNGFTYYHSSKFSKCQGCTDQHRGEWVSCLQAMPTYIYWATSEGCTNMFILILGIDGLFNRTSLSFLPSIRWEIYQRKLNVSNFCCL